MIAAPSPAAQRLVGVLTLVGLVFAPTGGALAASDATSDARSNAGARSAGSPCNQDGDCLGTRLCRAHRCVDVQCEGAGECPAGRVCRGFRCRRRECSEDAHCPVERSCEGGLCVLPQPPGLRSGNDRDAPDTSSGASTVDLSVGVAFPVGLLVCVDALLGGSRRVSLGLGTSLDSGGVSWRLGVHGQPHPVGPVSLDVWTAALGNSGGPSQASLSVAAVARGSGRGLFQPDRAVRAVWWGAGGGLTWRHGPTRGRLLRLEVGALVLLGDAYPATADYALLPSASLRYGWAW